MALVVSPKQKSFRVEGSQYLTQKRFFRPLWHAEETAHFLTCSVAETAAHKLTL